jgi:hypothetical protein
LLATLLVELIRFVDLLCYGLNLIDVIATLAFQKQDFGVKL